MIGTVSGPLFYYTFQTGYLFIYRVSKVFCHETASEPSTAPEHHIHLLGHSHHKLMFSTLEDLNFLPARYFLRFKTVDNFRIILPGFL